MKPAYKGTFVLDLDGVLFPFWEKFKVWVLKHGVTQEQVDNTDLTNYSFYESWGWNDATFVKMLKQFAEDREFEHGTPTAGAWWFVKRLREMGLKVIVATNRPVSAAGDTYRWCWRNLQVAKSDVYIANHKPDALMTVDRRPRHPKPWFAVDDYVKNIQALLDNGVHAFLWKQPWNTKQVEIIAYPGFDEILGVVENRLIMSISSVSDFWKGASQQQVAVKGEVTITNEQTGGKKGIKPERMDLIPVGPLTELSRVYGFGATKYADRNWEKGYDWSLSYGALLRHLTQWWNGEDKDAETECSHLASVAFHAFALMQFAVEHPELDDRPKRER